MIMEQNKELSIKEQAEIIYDKLDELARDQDSYDFGLPMFKKETGPIEDALNQWKSKYDELARWKKEASAILNPILDYGQKHPDIKLGGSITDFVVERCKQYDELKAEKDQLQIDMDMWKSRYKFLFADHEALKAKAQRLVDVLTSIEHAPVPANEREYISWFITAKNIAGGAISEWNATEEIEKWSKEPKEGEGI